MPRAIRYALVTAVAAIVFIAGVYPAVLSGHLEWDVLISRLVLYISTLTLGGSAVYAVTQRINRQAAEIESLRAKVDRMQQDGAAMRAYTQALDAASIPQARSRHLRPVAEERT